MSKQQPAPHARNEAFYRQLEEQANQTAARLLDASERHDEAEQLLQRRLLDLSREKDFSPPDLSRIEYLQNYCDEIRLAAGEILAEVNACWDQLLVIDDKAKSLVGYVPSLFPTLHTIRNESGRCRHHHSRTIADELNHVANLAHLTADGFPPPTVKAAMIIEQIRLVKELAGAAHDCRNAARNPKKYVNDRLKRSEKFSQGSDSQLKHAKESRQWFVEMVFPVIKDRQIAYNRIANNAIEPQKLIEVATANWHGRRLGNGASLTACDAALSWCEDVLAVWREHQLDSGEAVPALSDLEWLNKLDRKLSAMQADDMEAEILRERDATVKMLEAELAAEGKPVAVPQATAPPVQLTSTGDPFIDKARQLQQQFYGLAGEYPELHFAAINGGESLPEWPIVPTGQGQTIGVQEHEWKEILDSKGKPNQGLKDCWLQFEGKLWQADFRSVGSLKMGEDSQAEHERLQHGIEAFEQLAMKAANHFGLKLEPSSVNPDHDHLLKSNLAHRWLERLLSVPATIERTSETNWYCRCLSKGDIFTASAHAIGFLLKEGNGASGQAAAEGKGAGAKAGKENSKRVESSDAPPKKAATANTGKPLNERQTKLIQAFFNSNATDMDNRCSLDEAVSSMPSKSGSVPDSNSYKAVVKDLKAMGLIDSHKGGRNGGSWLTREGVIQARKIERQQAKKRHKQPK